MNRFLSILLAIGLSPLIAYSQEAKSGQTFTLEQAVSYALENSINIKNSALDERIADAKVKETRGIGLPQVNGGVGLRHNSQLPRFFSQFSVAQNFSGVDEEGNPNLKRSSVSPTDIVASQNFFQLKSAGDASVGLNQLIFNSSYLVGLKAANAYRDLSMKESEQTKEQVIENVSKAYYTCLINKDRVKLFDNNIARLDTLLRNTRALYQNGFAEKIDVDRIQVTYNNIVIERNKFLNLQAVSLELLKFQMNYPMNEPIEVRGEISMITIDKNILNTYQNDFDYSARSDYRILESNRKLQALDIKNKYSESLPSLVGFLNLGYSTQSANISGLFKTNTDTFDDGRVGPDKWYPYSNFGISLNVPLFSGLQRTFRLQQAKLTMMKIENGFTSLKAGIDFQIKQSIANYQNAIEAMDAQKQNLELAENVARITKIKYEQGVGSNLEVVQAESDLRETQINYFAALYDAIVAKIDLDKAYGAILPKENSSK